MSRAGAHDRRRAATARSTACRVPLFSDLLLHDIGTGDDIPQAPALPEEIRTPALWGLRFRRPLLHDGSAATIEEAIARHGGRPNERANVRRRSTAQARRRAARVSEIALSC